MSDITDRLKQIKDHAENAKVRCELEPFLISCLDVQALVSAFEVALESLDKIHGLAFARLNADAAIWAEEALAKIERLLAGDE